MNEFNGWPYPDRGTGIPVVLGKLELPLIIMKLISAIELRHLSSAKCQHFSTHAGWGLIVIGDIWSICRPSCAAGTNRTRHKAAECWYGNTMLGPTTRASAAHYGCCCCCCGGGGSLCFCVRLREFDCSRIPYQCTGPQYTTAVCQPVAPARRSPRRCLCQKLTWKVAGTTTVEKRVSSAVERWRTSTAWTWRIWFSNRK